jgi:hypothetical protein
VERLGGSVVAGAAVLSALGCVDEATDAVVDEAGPLSVPLTEAASVVCPAEVTVALVVAREAEGVQQESVDLVETYTSVPLYAGHPGTSVLTGPRPPPQSSKSHTSPLEGSSQWTMRSSQAVKLRCKQSAQTVFARSISGMVEESVGFSMMMQRIFTENLLKKVI